MNEIRKGKNGRLNMKENPWQRERERERREVGSGEGRAEGREQEGKAVGSTLANSMQWGWWGLVEVFRVPASLYTFSTLCLNVSQCLLLFCSKEVLGASALPWHTSRDSMTEDHQGRVRRREEGKDWAMLMAGVPCTHAQRRSDCVNGGEQRMKITVEDWPPFIR